MLFVAPLVGAWIEIRAEFGTDLDPTSLPSGERGLKMDKSRKCRIPNMSLPSWERGLKLDRLSITDTVDPRRSPRGSVD